MNDDLQYCIEILWGSGSSVGLWASVVPVSRGSFNDSETFCWYAVDSPPDWAIVESAKLQLQGKKMSFRGRWVRYSGQFP